LEKELNELKDQIRIKDEKFNIIQRGTLGRTLNTNLVRIIKGGHCKFIYLFLLDKQSVQLVDGEINLNTN
jgi:hypothetical protein